MVDSIVHKKISFDFVYPVPNGGNKLAKALGKYKTNTWQRIILIVDDVLTTGGSMEKVKQEILSQPHNDETTVKGCVVFARGECPDWIQSVFKMWN